MTVERSALVLFSGGIDSTTLLLYVMKTLGYERVEAITFDYGQRHRIELEYARRLARYLDVPFKQIAVDLKQIGGSFLTSEDEDLPMVVPGRNAIFLSLATAYAETKGLQYIFIGANRDDSKDFSDCLPFFINQMGLALSIGYNIEGIYAPLISKSKKEIVELGKKLQVPYNETWSCYNPTERSEPCHKCHACIERDKVLCLNRS